MNAAVLVAILLLGFAQLAAACEEPTEELLEFLSEMDDLMGEEFDVWLDAESEDRNEEDERDEL